MKIKNIISQYRRDFTALMECEFCKKTEIDKTGYDDTFYHTSVIPNVHCKSCGKSTISGGGKIEAKETKYPDGFQI
jgi:transcription elongation factor Elf1